MGSEQLKLIFKELTDIQVNLRKLGPEKREIYRSSVNKKLLRADSLYLKYKNVLDT